MCLQIRGSEGIQTLDLTVRSGMLLFAELHSHKPADFRQPLSYFIKVIMVTNPAGFRLGL